MQSDSQQPDTGIHRDGPAAAAPLDASPPRASRKVAWAAAGVLSALVAATALWAVREWRTNQVLTELENSISSRSPAPPRSGTQSNVPIGMMAAEPAPPAAQAQAPSTDRLPPLVLPGQPVPAAVLRDLPEWVRAEVAPAQAAGIYGKSDARSVAALPGAAGQSGTAGASGAAGTSGTAGTSGSSGTSGTSNASADEPAAPAAQRQRAAAAPRSDRYGAVFARCPGPGESGAVECRRAVCSGGARKAAACAPYLK